MIYNSEYIRNIFQTTAPVQSGIFGILRPTEIAKFCVAIGMKLDYREKKLFMSPIREIYTSNKIDDTLLLIGDVTKRITDYKELHKRIHIHHIPKQPLPEFSYTLVDHTSVCVSTISKIMDDIDCRLRKNVLFLRQGHGYIHASDFIALSFTSEIEKTRNHNTFHSTEYVNDIIQSSPVVNMKMRQWRPGSYSIPCAVYTINDWYFDFIDVEFYEEFNPEVRPPYVLPLMLHYLLYAILTLRSNPSIFKCKRVVGRRVVGNNNHILNDNYQI